MALDGDERLDARAGQAPCREEGEITVADIAADQKAAGPQSRSGLIIFVRVEIGEIAVAVTMGDAQRILLDELASWLIQIAHKAGEVRSVLRNVKNCDAL